MLLRMYPIYGLNDHQVTLHRHYSYIPCRNPQYCHLHKLLKPVICWSNMHWLLVNKTTSNGTISVSFWLKDSIEAPSLFLKTMLKSPLVLVLLVIFSLFGFYCMINAIMFHMGMCPNLYLRHFHVPPISGVTTISLFNIAMENHHL